MKKLFLPFLIFILFVTADHAEELNAVRQANVTVLFDTGLENAAVSVAGTYPDVKDGLEKIIGWKVDFSPTVYLVKTHERFLRMSGHPLVIGFAVPERMLIVLDFSKLVSGSSSLRSIMKHELCHLLLHKNIKSKNLPRWLDEGVSQWVSGGTADIVMAEITRVDSAIVTGRQISFKYLSGSFPGDNDNLVLAYAQSKSIVEYMVNEYGTKGLLNMLGSLGKGNDIEEAVHETFLITFDQLEKNWYSAMNKKITWLNVFIEHLYEVLFFIGALSLIIAYIKTVIRKRARQYEEDDDQQGHPL